MNTAREILMFRNIGPNFGTVYSKGISNVCNYILTCKIHVLDMHQMQPKEITEVHEYTSNYYNFYTRQLDNKILINLLFKSD